MMMAPMVKDKDDRYSSDTNANMTNEVYYYFFIDTVREVQAVYPMMRRIMSQTVSSRPHRRIHAKAAYCPDRRKANMQT